MSVTVHGGILEAIPHGISERYLHEMVRFKSEKHTWTFAQKVKTYQGHGNLRTSGVGQNHVEN